MNQDQFVSIVAKIIVTACAGIAAKWGFTSDLPGLAATIAPAVVALAVFAWTHWYNGQPTSPVQPSGSPAPKLRRLWLLWILIIPSLALVSGCALTQEYTHGCVTTIQSRGFGIRLTATSSTTATPEIDLGAFSSLITVYPTSTNQLYCTPFFSTAMANATSNPFDVGINETIGAGNVASAISTNGSASSVVVPKLVRPAYPTYPIAPSAP